VFPVNCLETLQMLPRNGWVMVQYLLEFSRNRDTFEPMSSRRKFLKQLAMTGAVLPVIPEVLGAAARAESVLVMHTNDFHSRMDPFPEKHPKFGGQGGIAKLSTLIHGVRQENKQTLLLDCGDIFQGTPYFNVFGGVAEIQWMNQAGYDASTLGNHDFDNGVEKLASVLGHAQFPVVNCNYRFSGTALESIIKPWIVKQVGRKRIGITGAGINPEGLILDRLCKGIVYQDPVKAVQTAVDTLKSRERCDAVIVLSHLGYSYEGPQIDDKKLAAATHGIDLILGGHTHTFLEQAEPVRNAKGKTVHVNQAGWAGLKLGRVAIEF
jgi:5'-nucleotidase